MRGVLQPHDANALLAAPASSGMAALREGAGVLEARPRCHGQALSAACSGGLVSLRMHAHVAMIRRAWVLWGSGATGV